VHENLPCAAIRAAKLDRETALTGSPPFPASVPAGTFLQGLFRSIMLARGHAGGKQLIDTGPARIGGTSGSAVSSSPMVSHFHQGKFPSQVDAARR
jgi:hypothetical protein